MIYNDLFNETIRLSQKIEYLQEEKQADVENLNMIWMLLCGSLIFFMQAGFSMLEAGGMARKVLAESIMIKNTVMIALGGITWYLLGYGIAFGVSPAPSICGTTYFALKNNPPMQQWFFRWGFACTAATIVSGAMSERTRLRSHAYWAVLMVTFVHSFMAHWIWSSTGWLSSHLNEDKLLFANGVIDFAGSGVVHLLGGVAGLIGAIVSKPRYGRFEEIYERKRVFYPHDVGIMSLGTFILYFSWFGYNCGSTLRLDTSQASVAAKVSVNTFISASTSALVSLLIVKIRHGIWDMPSFLNGILSGLVAITAGCAFVEPWAALIMGFISGVLYYLAVNLERSLMIDDVLYIGPVHAANGLWGLLAVGLFATKENIFAVYRRDDYAGLFMGGGGLQLAAQLLGAIVITAWTALWAISFFVLINHFGYLRIDKVYEKRLFEETLTKIEIKSTLHRMACDYQLDMYIRHVEDNTQSHPENSPGEFLRNVIERKVTGRKDMAREAKSSSEFVEKV